MSISKIDLILDDLKGNHVLLAHSGGVDSCVLAEIFINKKIMDKNINIICGHFEGLDQRLLETRNIEEVSVGDFVLSGGEVGALVIIDTIVRLIPGVLGNPNS